MGIKYDVQIKAEIKYYADRIQLIRKMNKDLKTCKKLFPDVHFWLDRDLNASPTCKSMAEVKEMLKIFAKAGYMLEEFRPNDTRPGWNLKGKSGIRICLSPYWTENEEGATCRLVQVGVEHREFDQPVYKLMCDGKESAPTE